MATFCQLFVYLIEIYSSFPLENILSFLKAAILLKGIVLCRAEYIADPVLSIFFSSLVFTQNKRTALCLNPDEVPIWVAFCA